MCRQFLPSTNQYSYGLLSNDKGICDEMINCHLSETWSSIMQRQTHFPVSRIIDEMPILSSYAPQNSSNMLQTYPNGFLNGTCHDQRMESFVKPLSKTQQQLMQEVYSGPPLNRNNDPTKQYYVCQAKVNEQSEKIKTSIKYQDRNKKLDFKLNFRDENRKVNGCFHRDDKFPKNTSRIASAPPPKKKWIRHYMTGKTVKKKLEICLCVGSNQPASSELYKQVTQHFFFISHTPTTQLAIQ